MDPEKLICGAIVLACLSGAIGITKYAKSRDPKPKVESIVTNSYEHASYNTNSISNRTERALEARDYTNQLNQSQATQSRQ